MHSIPSAPALLGRPSLTLQKSLGNEGTLLHQAVLAVHWCCIGCPELESIPWYCCFTAAVFAKGLVLLVILQVISRKVLVALLV